MITRFSFWHINSTRSLARHLRRNAAHLKKIEHHLTNMRKKVKTYYDMGDEEETSHEEIEVIDTLGTKDDLMTHMITEEDMVLYDLLKHENKQKDETATIINKHKGRYGNLLKDVYDLEEKTERETLEFIHFIKVQEKTMWLRRGGVATMNLISAYGDETQATSIRKEARREKWDIKDEKRDMNKFHKLLIDFDKAVSKKNPDEKDLQKITTQLNNEAKEILKDFRHIMNHVKEVIIHISIITKRLHDEIEQEIPKELHKWRDEGMDTKFISPMVIKLTNLRNHIHENEENMFKMARFEERKARKIYNN